MPRAPETSRGSVEEMHSVFRKNTAVCAVQLAKTPFIKPFEVSAYYLCNQAQDSKLYGLPTECVCVFGMESLNKHKLFSYTVLIDWC
jgi:hypothetical protein